MALHPIDWSKLGAPVAGTPVSADEYIASPFGHTYEVRVDSLEVTKNGWFGGEPDVMRQFVSGPKHYFIDGVEVTYDEYVASLGGATQGTTFTYRQD